MVPEGIVARRNGDALVNGNLLRGRVVSDANVDEARLEILDAVGGVAGVPGNSEGLGAIGDGIFDVRICESYRQQDVLDLHMQEMRISFDCLHVHTFDQTTLAGTAVADSKLDCPIVPLDASVINRIRINSSRRRRNGQSHNGRKLAQMNHLDALSS